MGGVREQCERGRLPLRACTCDGRVTRGSGGGGSGGGRGTLEGVGEGRWQQPWVFWSAVLGHCGLFVPAGWGRPLVYAEMGDEGVKGGSAGGRRGGKQGWDCHMMQHAARR